MKQLRTISILLLLTVLLSDCKKKGGSDTTVKKTFSFQCSDTLVFDNVKSILLPVTVSSSSGNFDLSLQNISDGNFNMIKNNVNCPANESRSLEIKYVPISVEPGIHTCQLRVVDMDDGSNVMYKTIYLVIRPACAFNFRNFINGKITYYINGIATYKSIACQYEIDNSLRVTNLSTWNINLNLDCINQTCTIKPVTVNGYLKGGTGTFTDTKISFTISDNGTAIADAEIYP